MATRTVYVKNEQLWDTAKSIAGTAGLSRFVEEALERLVASKQVEQKGLERFCLPVEPIHDFTPEVKETLQFDGECLVDREDLSFSVYRTKAGKFIVTDNFAGGSISDYRVYEDLFELRKASGRIEKDQLWDLICEALPQHHITTVID